jgi:hypothetical protein
VALPPSLHSVDLAYYCPHCDHPLVRPGSWFKSAWRFKCESCKSAVVLSYSTKLALFDRHHESVQRGKVASDSGKERVAAPSVVSLADTSANKTLHLRKSSSARRDASVPETNPRIIFGDKRFQEGT